MKFPENATAATQANWIALQDLKLQVAHYKLCRDRKKLDILKKELGGGEIDCEVLEMYECAIKDRTECIAILQREVMAAQVGDKEID